jgi:hypothetical protein
VLLGGRVLTSTVGPGGTLVALLPPGAGSQRSVVVRVTRAGLPTPAPGAAAAASGPHVAVSAPAWFSYADPLALFAEVAPLDAPATAVLRALVLGQVPAADTGAPPPAASTGVGAGATGATTWAALENVLPRVRRVTLRGRHFGAPWSAGEEDDGVVRGLVVRPTDDAGLPVDAVEAGYAGPGVSADGCVARRGHVQKRV